MEQLVKSRGKQSFVNSDNRTQLILDANDLLLSDYPASRGLSESQRKRLINQAVENQLGADTTERVAIASATGSDPSPGVASADVGIRGFLVSGETDSITDIQAATDQVFGSDSDWIVKPTEDKAPASFTITNPNAVVSVKEAWDISYKLRNEAAIKSAEPDIEWLPAPAEMGGPVPDRMITILRAEKYPACSTSKTWSADNVLKISNAWKATDPSKQKGIGIKIGHLDTGITEHVELPPLDETGENAQIQLSKGLNIYDPEKTNKKPLDPMDPSWNDFFRNGFSSQLGHGTQTLSVLLSHGGQIKGTAPAATVIPFRINPTVVHWNARRLAEGIRRAHAAGCDVITISMGGAPSAELKRAVKAATDDGVIICAAAGNIIGSSNILPIVVWPAALDEVIAVGGSNCENTLWSGSSRGPEVNITAPAQNVWRATALAGALPGTGKKGSELGRGDGTSYATPATAGVAACWLAKWGGRDAIARVYGKDRRYVPMAFARLLRTKGYDEHPNWRKDLLGPGTLNAEKLMKADLPKKNELSWPKKDHSISNKVLAAIFRAIHLFGGNSVGPMAANGPAVLPDDIYDADAFVEQYRDEMLYHLMDRPKLLEELQEAGILKEEDGILIPKGADGGVSPASASSSRERNALNAVKQRLSALASDSLRAQLQ